MQNLDYSTQHVSELLEKEDIDGVKQYVKQYFYKIDAPPAIAYWKPSLDSFCILQRKDLSNFFLSSHTIEKTIKKKTFTEFSLMDYFLNDVHDRYNVETNPHQDRIYSDKGIKYINLSPRYALDRQNIKKFDEYEGDIKSRVMLILNHINFAICGGKENQFKYMKQWLAHAICGVRKMKSIIYMKSGQGTGKSIVFEEFIIPLILGEGLSLMTSDMNCIIGNFNNELHGKLLLVLEEVPADNKNIWMSFSNKLKTVATGKRININKKHKDPISVLNLLNVILLTNNNAVKLESDDRRYVPVDINDTFVGDINYFNKLVEAMNFKGVAEAFYVFLREIVDPTFNEMILPVTDNKVDLINENLHPVYKYIKANYIKPHENIDCAFSDLYDEYKENSNDSKTSNIAFSKILKAIHIDTTVKKVGTTTSKWIKYTYTELYDIFKKKNFIHDLDEIDINQVEPEKKVNDLDYPFVPETQKKKPLPKIPIKKVEIKETKSEIIQESKPKKVDDDGFIEVNEDDLSRHIDFDDI